MSEPVLSRVHVSPFADVLFVANIENAPDIALPSGRTVRPRALEIRYFFDFVTARWGRNVKVMGHRVHRDGTVSTSPSNAAFGDGDGMPEWLARIVTQNRPAAILPDLRILNA